MDGFNADVNTLKIGFKNYTIEKPDEITEVKAYYYGITDYDKSLIKVAGKFEQHDKNHTFIHELIHCVCMRLGLKELNDDEQTVDLLAMGIYEAIIDNPHLFRMADI